MSIGFLIEIRKTTKPMKNLSLSFFTLLLASAIVYANACPNDDETENSFIGMWGMSIESGGVAWLNIHENQGFLDGELLWIGGSVLPVSDIYLVDDNTLVVTRTGEKVHEKGESDKERTHIRTWTLRITKTGDAIKGTMTGPSWDGTGEQVNAFSGKRMPPVGPAPDLKSITYGKPISLFNGKDTKGWRPIDPKKANGFKVVNGTLQNDPVQPEDGTYLSYGNLRTEAEFNDFNLKLEVNVPEGHNSGIFLKGLYEVQVVDSYGSPVDSHNMGALYSRITPTEAVEKPGGEWQTLDITLVDRHVTIILNGTKIIDNKAVDGPTGGAMSPDVFAPGPLYLQGDHGNVAYRNIVLTPVL